MASFKKRYQYAKRSEGDVNQWPGFVDAMATILLVIIFLLSFFILAQFFLTQELTGRDSVLNTLKRQLNEITDLFASEQSLRADAENSIASLNNQLSLALLERDNLADELKNANNDDRVSQLQEDIGSANANVARSESQVSVLNQQVAALRRQIAELNGLLLASEERAKSSEETIVQLNSRLNSALVRTAQTLAKYQSTFLRKMREILKDRSDIRVVDDRFVFQSEVLFDSGSADINVLGKRELKNLAEALKEIEKEIPSDFDWILRVDGHTDSDPISTEKFPSNWELSTTRSLAVVKELINQGISPNRLVAAGFGEFQPVVIGTTAAENSRNRRIELKLTTP